MTVPIGVLHFSPLYWTDPEKFDPERLVSNFKIYIITGFHPVEVGASPSKKKERERERERDCMFFCAAVLYVISLRLAIYYIDIRTTE